MQCWASRWVMTEKQLKEAFLKANQALMHNESGCLQQVNTEENNRADASVSCIALVQRCP